MQMDGKTRTSVWDADEKNEIVLEVDLEREVIVDFYKTKAEIVAGCCFSCHNCCSEHAHGPPLGNGEAGPWRWTDMSVKYNAMHVAVTAHNVLYLVEKVPHHVLNPCPPCCCCMSSNYKEDYAPKMRKSIPLEKITDIEIQEAGSNELVSPTCCYHCPPRCNPESLEIPFSRSSINTAGSIGFELVIEGVKDPKAFKQVVMDQKRGASGHSVSAVISSAPGQHGMSIGADSEVTKLLQDIAESNRGILQALQDQK